MQYHNIKTDTLFELIPNIIKVNGYVYSFRLRKSVRSNKIITRYENVDGKSLDNVIRIGSTLNDALSSMVNWLHTSEYYDIKTVYRKLKIKKVLELED